MLGTPIGHLGDFSFRGLDVLRQVAGVAAEDTRRTRRLLGHYEVAREVVSLHAHSRPEVIERLLDRVEGGADVAYVTDEGTPGISYADGDAVRGGPPRPLIDDLDELPFPDRSAAPLTSLKSKKGRASPTFS